MNELSSIRRRRSTAKTETANSLLILRLGKQLIRPGRACDAYGHLADVIKNVDVDVRRTDGDVDGSPGETESLTAREKARRPGGKGSCCRGGRPSSFSI